MSLEKRVIFMLGGITKYSQYNSMIRSMGSTPMDMNPAIAFSAKSLIVAKQVNPINKSLYKEFNSFVKDIKSYSKDILESVKKMDPKEKDSLTNSKNEKVKNEDIYKEAKKMIQEYSSLKNKLSEKNDNYNSIAEKKKIEGFFEKNKDKIQDLGFKEDDKGNIELDKDKFIKKLEENPEETKKQLYELSKDIKKDRYLENILKKPQSYFFSSSYQKGSILNMAI